MTVDGPGSCVVSHMQGGVWWPFVWFSSHLCRWCSNTRTKSGTSFRLSKKLLVALLRTLFREAAFIPSHWPETVFSPRRCFPVTVIGFITVDVKEKFYRPWDGSWNHEGLSNSWLMGGQFFPKRNSTITVACSFSEAVGMNCGECVWFKIFCTNSNVNALIKLCMTYCQLKKKREKGSMLWLKKNGIYFYSEEKKKEKTP